MDPTTAVRTDTFPAVATLLAPGAIASGTYVWYGLAKLPDIGTFLAARDALAAVVLILLLIAAGLIVESLGSYVEVYLIDRRRSDHDKVIKTWWKYLRIAWEHEPIGQRYLRRLMVNFKFELNMFTAFMAAVPGILILRYGNHITIPMFWGFMISVIVAALLFFRAARDSADVLARAREELANGSVKK